MKRLLYLLTLIICFIVTSCSETDKTPMIIGCPDYLTLYDGDTYKLNITVDPDYMEDLIIYESTNPYYASIDETGTITAKTPGKVNIIIRVKNIVATCFVTIERAPSGITISNKDINLIKGEEIDITARIIPNDAINKEIEWYSNNTEVATVKEGKITALKSGHATITASPVINPKQIKDECKVTVYDDAIIIQETDCEIIQGSLHTVHFTNTLGGIISNIKIESENPDIATFNLLTEKDVTIYAYKPGKTKITISAENYLSATFNVNVTDLKKINVSISGSDIVDVGDSFLIYSYVEDGNACINPIWYTSDPDIIEITSQGQFTNGAIGTPKKNGFAYIYAKYGDIIGCCPVCIGHDTAVPNEEVDIDYHSILSILNGKTEITANASVEFISPLNDGDRSIILNGYTVVRNGNELVEIQDLNLSIHNKSKYSFECAPKLTYYFSSIDIDEMKQINSETDRYQLIVTYTTAYGEEITKRIKLAPVTAVL